MKQLRIGFDIDDVLVNTADSLVILHNQLYGTNINLTHMYADVGKDWGVADHRAINQRIQDVMRTEQWGELIKPVEGAAKILKQLKAEGCELFAVTGRPASTRQATLALLERFYPGIFTDQTLFMTDIFALDGLPVQKVTKLDIARQLHLTHFVEDYLVHADVLAEGGIKTVLFGDYPWSEKGGHAHLVRLNSWQAIGAFFDDERRTT